MIEAGVALHRPGVAFHYRPGRKGEYADEILAGFDGTIQVDAYGGYSHLATTKRTGGKPLQLAFCWSHGRRKLIKATPKNGSPIVDEALARIAALVRNRVGIASKQLAPVSTFDPHFFGFG